MKKIETNIGSDKDVVEDAAAFDCAYLTDRHQAGNEYC